MRSTFKVLFYLKRNAPKKNGHVPYYRKRQNRSIQSQIGRRGEIVERGVGRLSYSQKPCSDGEQSLFQSRAIRAKER